MRKTVTSRFKRGSLFDKRIVITLPRSGVAVLALGLAGALVIPAAQGKIMVALGLILSVVAIATVLEARHQIRTFRYEMQERISAWVESCTIPDDTDLRESVEAAFKEVDDATTRRIRLPKPRQS
jgi:hypothetical protein